MDGKLRINIFMTALIAVLLYYDLNIHEDDQRPLAIISGRLGV